MSSINEIIKISIKLAETEFKDLQQELKKEEGSIQKRTEKAIVKRLQKILAELSRLERVLMKNLAGRESPSKEKLKQYMKKRDKLLERIEKFRDKIKEFAEEI